MGRTCSLCLSPEQGQRQIYRAAHRAVERLITGEKFALFTSPSPATVTITYKHTADADAAFGFGAKRLDGYTVERTYGRLSELYGGLWEDYGIAQRVQGEKV